MMKGAGLTNYSLLTIEEEHHERERIAKEPFEEPTDPHARTTDEVVDAAMIVQLNSEVAPPQSGRSNLHRRTTKPSRTSPSHKLA